MTKQQYKTNIPTKEIKNFLVIQLLHKKVEKWGKETMCR